MDIMHYYVCIVDEVYYLGIFVLSTNCIIATSEQAGVLVLLQQLPLLPNSLQHIWLKHPSPTHVYQILKK